MLCDGYRGGDIMKVYRADNLAEHVSILDFGYESGRDTKYFSRKGMIRP